MEYREALLRTIDGWNADPIQDEWLFEKFRANVVNGMSASAAFDAIDLTIGILLREADESTSTEILQTTISLAEKSKTTEIPKGLMENRLEIENKFSFFGDYAKNKLQELLRYYRM